MRIRALALLLIPIALSAQPRPTIHGVVLSPSGKPVQGATVEFTQRRWEYWSFARVYKTKSDQLGRFEIPSVSTLPCYLNVTQEPGLVDVFLFSLYSEHPEKEWTQTIKAQLSGPCTLLDGGYDLPLDMTTPTQGKTFDTRELAAVPMR